MRRAVSLAFIALTVLWASVAPALADTNAPSRIEFFVICEGVRFDIVSPNVPADAAHHVSSTSVLVLKGFQLYDLATGELILTDNKKFVEKQPGLLTECEEIDTERGIRAVVQVLITPLRG